MNQIENFMHIRGFYPMKSKFITFFHGIRLFIVILLFFGMIYTCFVFFQMTVSDFNDSPYDVRYIVFILLSSALILMAIRLSYHYILCFIDALAKKRTESEKELPKNIDL